MRRILALAAAATLLGTTLAGAQTPCPVTEVTSGLTLPLGITQSNLGNLIVSETGTSTPNTGRITVVGPDGGAKRTLLQGLPSGINDVGEPSGPAGVFMQGRTLYVAIGVGDVGRAGPLPGTTVPNPDPPSSPLFSSILAIHFSANVERGTSTFTLTLADHEGLADGERVRLNNGNGEEMTIERVADFEDYIPNPLPFFADNVRLSNPFDLIFAGGRIHVTDGGRNLVWTVELESGDFAALAEFPQVPNPVTPFGPPFIDAVPTGIARSGNRLLVTLFRGFPFPPGTSVVEEVDRRTGSHAPFIAGLQTAIDVLPIDEGGSGTYLVLQHVSGPPGPPATGGPGSLLQVGGGSAPVTLVDCLARPTSMTLDEGTGTLYITELSTGRIVSVSLGDR